MPKLASEILDRPVRLELTDHILTEFLAAARLEREQIEAGTFIRPVAA